MKTRVRFVSNSSSSSFCIRRYWVSDHQLDRIRNRLEEAAKLALEYPECAEWWTVKVGRDLIFFETGMDNFHMIEFLEEIGISEEAFEEDVDEETFEIC